MNVLQKIVEDKKEFLAQSKKDVPISEIMNQSKNAKAPGSFLQAVRVRGVLSVIAEMKKMSPSAGTLLEKYEPGKIARAYERAGARALSVLTEEKHFAGSLDHILEARQAARLPVLRKDFIFDPYQVYESRARGASCLLLITAILDPTQLTELLDLSREIKLDALVEVHDEKELEAALKAGAEMVGINNRNLKDLAVDIETTFRLRKNIPESVCVISESGINSPETITRLRRAWVQGALIGESILKIPDMEATLKSFVRAGLRAQEARLN